MEKKGAGQKAESEVLSTPKAVELSSAPLQPAQYCPRLFHPEVESTCGSSVVRRAALAPWSQK